MFRFKSSTNNGFVPRTNDWNKTTSTTTTHDPDHVHRPVILDSEGRKHPIVTYSTPNHTETYVTETETIVQRITVPATEYKYSSSADVLPPKTHKYVSPVRERPIEYRHSSPKKERPLEYRHSSPKKGTHSPYRYGSPTKSTHSPYGEYKHPNGTHSPSGEYKHPNGTHSPYGEYKHANGTHSLSSEYKQTNGTHLPYGEYKHANGTHSPSGEYKHRNGTHSPYGEYRHRSPTKGTHSPYSEYRQTSPKRTTHDPFHDYKLSSPKKSTTVPYTEYKSSSPKRDTRDPFGEYKHIAPIKTTHDPYEDYKHTAPTKTAYDPYDDYKHTTPGKVVVPVKERGYEDKWQSRPISPERPKPVDDFLNKVQTEVSRPTKFSPLPANLWKRSPNNNKGYINGYGDYDDLNRKEPLNRNSNTGGWSRPNPSGWSRQTNTPLSEPTNDIGTAIEALTEAFRPTTTTTTPHSRIPVPITSRNGYTESFEPREGTRRYPNFNLQSHNRYSHAPIIDSNEALRKYNGTTV